LSKWAEIVAFRPESSIVGMVIFIFTPFSQELARSEPTDSDSREVRKDVPSPQSTRGRSDDLSTKKPVAAYLALHFARIGQILAGI
jgi:hypothetical protein